MGRKESNQTTKTKKEIIIVLALFNLERILSLLLLQKLLKQSHYISELKQKKTTQRKTVVMPFSGSHWN